jgi:hypothetical protein
MTRRIPPRSAIASVDPDLARQTTVELSETAVPPSGVGRARSLRDLARSVVPAAILADVPERAALGEWLRGLGRRGS